MIIGKCQCVIKLSLNRSLSPLQRFLFAIPQETDWEATNEAIEEQVARESYLQWLQVGNRKTRFRGLRYLVGDLSCDNCMIWSKISR